MKWVKLIAVAMLILGTVIPVGCSDDEIADSVADIIVGKDSKNSSSSTPIPTGALPCKAAFILNYVHSYTKTAVKGDGSSSTWWYSSIKKQDGSEVLTERSQEIVIDAYGMATFTYTHTLRPDEYFEITVLLHDDKDAVTELQYHFLNDLSPIPPVTTKFMCSEFQKEAIKIDNYYLLTKQVEMVAGY
jgi:hypothetical protein